MLRLLWVLTPMLAGAAQDTSTVQVDAPPRRVELVEELRIGSLDGAEHELFGDVWHMAVGEDGTMYVSDVQVPAIRMYDRLGAYLADLGGEGEGPGEFLSIQGVAVTGDGRVVIWDPNLRRASVFTSGGEFSHSFPVATSTMISGPNLSVSIDMSNAVLIPTLAELPTRVNGIPEARFAWLRYDTQGEFRDSVIAPVRRLEGVLATAATKSGVRHPFRVHTVSALAPDGSLVSARSDAFQVTRTSPSGDVLEIIRPTEAVRVSRAERNQWRAIARVWDERWGTSSPDVPSEKPPLHDLRVDAEGRIWVLRTVEASHDPDFVHPSGERLGWPPMNWYEAETYDVLSPEGDYLGSVSLPERASLLFARGDLVWCRSKGEFDEQYVVRYRIDGLDD